MTKLGVMLLLGLVGLVFSASLFGLIGVLPVMLTLGILHANFVRIPALGFWATFVCLVGLRVVLGAAQISLTKD